MAWDLKGMLLLMYSEARAASCLVTGTHLGDFCTKAIDVAVAFPFEPVFRFNQWHRASS